MSQLHGDRLTGLDAGFLAQEDASAHMHIGAVLVFEGPAPSYADLLEHIGGRLHLVPRYRQKLAFPPLESGHPLWVDDPSFQLAFHVRDTALPAPGSEAQLRALVARIHSQALDRSKPLWEVWLVHGLEHGRFAFLFKNHHALVDGIAGIDLMTLLLDVSREPRTVPPPEAPWRPEPTPSAAGLLARGLSGVLRAPLAVARDLIDAAEHPETTLDTALERIQGLGEVAWTAVNPPPDSPLNVPIGPHRRVVWARHRLEDFKEVKNAFGATVNDVLLTVVAGGLRRWLHGRGVRTEGLELRGLVPVSIRAKDRTDALGNRIVAMRGPLPVYVEAPVARLQVVKAAMDGLKESRQALGAELLAGVQGFAPLPLLAHLSVHKLSYRLTNLLVTNVPGPQFPLYLLGRELEAMWPVAFLPGGHALSIAIVSYHGVVHFGLLGDYDAMPDLDDLGAYLDDSLEELVAAARAQTGRNGSSRPERAPIEPAVAG